MKWSNITDNVSKVEFHSNNSMAFRRLHRYILLTFKVDKNITWISVSVVQNSQ